MCGTINEHGQKPSSDTENPITSKRSSYAPNIAKLGKLRVFYLDQWKYDKLWAPDCPSQYNKLEINQKNLNQHFKLLNDTKRLILHIYVCCLS